MAPIEILGDKFRWLYPSIFGKLKDSFLASILFYGGGLWSFITNDEIGGGGNIKYMVVIYSKKYIQWNQVSLNIIKQNQKWSSRALY